MKKFWNRHEKFRPDDVVMEPAGRSDNRKQADRLKVLDMPGDDICVEDIMHIPKEARIPFLILGMEAAMLGCLSLIFFVLKVH